MKIWIVIGMVCFGILYGAEECILVQKFSTPQWKEEIASIDEVLTKLIDLRNKELANASWAQHQGDHLQFHSHTLIDARKYWREADTSRKIAARYQEEIDKLELRKQQVFKQQGIDYTLPES